MWTFACAVDLRLRFRLLLDASSRCLVGSGGRGSHTDPATDSRRGVVRRQPASQGNGSTGGNPISLEVCLAGKADASQPWRRLLFFRPFAPADGAASIATESKYVMAKNTRKVNKANHGKRPASSLARKAKRRKMGV